MSNNWSIDDKGPSSSGCAAEALSVGLLAAQHEYECTNEETGEVKTVWAYSSDGAGKKIASGEFDD